MNQTRVALVTGAGSGIGRASALALGRDGFRVVVAGRRSEQLEETVALGAQDGTPMLAVSCDVTDRRSIADLFVATLEFGGRLDLLFNNAGVFSPPKLLEDLSEDDWVRVVATNLSGAFYCTQEAFSIMKSQSPIGGRIINNGSVSAYVPRPNSAPYTATKHAITGLTKSTSLDGRKYNIACGQIDVGNARTELAAGFINGIAQADGTVRPEPGMDVEDVARAVSYMAGLPLEANVQFMTVMATAMPYIGRG